MDSVTNSQTQQLPLYQCHKKVRAAKISQLEILATGWRHQAPDAVPEHVAALHLVSPSGASLGSIKVSAGFMEKHQPQEGGYYVVYEDGYPSYSPAKPMEEGYSLLSY